jgi:hypothetical protein
MLILCFAVMLLAFAIVRAPAFVLDHVLAQASDGRIRLGDSRGTLWHGSGLLVERDAGHHRPWIELAWHVGFSELWRGRLMLALAIDGQAAARAAVTTGGFGIDLPGASLPLAPLVRSLPHPTARLGWNGRLHAGGELAHCSWKFACDGRLRLDIDTLSLSVLPNARLGRYRLDIGTDAAGLRLGIDSAPDNRLAARGNIEMRRGGRSKGEIVLGGERDFVRQIGAMTADIAHAAADGSLHLAW